VWDSFGRVVGSDKLVFVPNPNPNLCWVDQDPAQIMIMKPDIGRHASCAVGDCYLMQSGSWPYAERRVSDVSILFVQHPSH